MIKANSDNIDKKNSVKKQLLAQNNSINKIIPIKQNIDKSGDKEKQLKMIRETG